MRFYHLLSSFAFVALSANLAQAGVSMNSMCYLAPNEQKTTAFNPTKQEIEDSGSVLLKKIPTGVTEEDVKAQFRIASLSKVFTSHWAIMKLGPEYRFTTQIIVTPGHQKGLCNLHFRGDGDPILGREVLAEVFKDLKPRLSESNCSSIDTVSYDENFRVLLDAMSHQKSTDALKSFGWSNPALYDNAQKTQTDLVAFLKHKSGLKVNLEKVGPVSRARYEEYLKDVPAKVFEFKSRPLFRILKELNKYSHNYITNVIFNRLGGAAEYEKFILQRLKLTSAQIKMLNGSGYPITDENGDKHYNLASCDALVTVLKDLDLGLAAVNGTRKYQMADIMAVGGPNEDYSTFKGHYISSTFDNTLVAKTGSADRAITFGGVLSTAQGDLYFGVLTSPDNYSAPDLPNARDYIRALMGVLSERVKLKKFEYTPDGATSPFDSEVRLKEVSSSAAKSTLSAAVKTNPKG